MKLKHSLLNGARISLWLGAILGVLRDWDLFANPAGLTVVSGSGHAQQAGSQLNVTVSQTAILNWSSFNIKAGEATTFLQPSANSVVFNQIGDANPSQIFGNLNANGTVILANANGFYFGPNSMISIGGSFIATTSPLTPDFGAGSAWTFTGMPPLASIVNYGQIKVGTGKSLYLIAEQIDNHGELAAPGGDIGLYAGQSVLVSERPDGRGLSATMTVPGGSVNNFGQITADAGTIALQAQVVNQNGIIQADSVQNKNGVIELVASDSLTLGADSRILARGDDSVSGSTGGSVTLKSQNIFSDASGSTIVTAGGVNGGNGGNVEVSAPNIRSLNSAMDAGAKAGFSGGSFLLDPANIILGTIDGGTVPANGTVGSSDNGNGAVSGTLTLNVNKAFLNKNFSNIKLQATQNITLNSSTTWNLSTSTGITVGQLTLQAGGDIIFGNGAKITDANNWSVSLAAGYNFGNNTVQTTVGNILLNGGNGQTGSGSIQTAFGNISLAAGNGIQIGSGAVSTTGGNVSGLAGGDITFGNSSKITTAANGSVTLDAGYNFGNNTVQNTAGNIFLNGGSGQSGSGSILTALGNISLAAGSGIQIGYGAVSTTGGNVTGLAGGDITFGNSSKITTAATGSVTLDAGYDFSSQSVIAGGNKFTIGGNDVYLGNVFLNGKSGGTLNGTIITGAGGINLQAGLSVLVGSGSIYSTGGGSIYAYAMAGDINAGTSNGAISGNTKASNYNFTDAGAMPNTAGLGGISTMAGGNVTLIAGNNINSTSIADTTKQWPAASGTYGSGDVNIIAGNQINGNYILANGVGTMLAGVQVQAAQAAVLQNPNASPTTYAATLHDLETAVTQATGPKGNIGGVIVANKSSVGVSLSLIQGSWNVWAANNILLNEVNNPNGTYNKDSSSQTSYLYNYASDAAANFWAGNAIELGGGKVGGTLARLNLAKNLKTIIYAPKLSLNAGAGGIQVDASIILAPSSEGSLDIVTRDGGNLTGAVTPGSTTLTSITMSDSGSTGFSTFATGHAATPLHLNDPNPVVVDISGSIGNFGLTVPTFAELTVHGTQPYVAPDGPVFGTYNFGFIGRNLSPLQTTFIDVTGAISYQDFSAANPDARLGSQGLTLAGPGFFDITANSINLGVSGGINVIAPDSGLAAISPYGAQLDVTTLGNLTLTSSAIANVGYLGGIQLNIGGELDAGGQFSQAGEAGAAKGIFTTSGGGVSVMAQGNVNVDGSRINTYNGGNINITSVNGDVNAGAGDAGYVNVHALELDPTTHQLVGISWQIPGSGIWATTLVGSHATVGNISVNAPKGSINASSGGILQIAFNGTDTKNSLIDLNAGLDIIASGSGVIGANVNLKAGRTISGLFVAQHNLNAAAPSFGAGVLFGQKVSVDTGNSGTPVGIQIISDNPVSENGVEVAATAPDVASAPTQVAQTAEDATAVADTANSLGDDTEELNKKKKGITLASKVSRVTVLLPTKNN